MDAASLATRGAPEISWSLSEHPSAPQDMEALMENLLHKTTRAYLHKTQSRQEIASLRPVQQFNGMDATSIATRGAPETSWSLSEHPSPPQDFEELTKNLLHKTTQRIIGRRAGKTKQREIIKIKSFPDIVEICHAGDEPSSESQDDASTCCGSNAFSRSTSEFEEVDTEPPSPFDVKLGVDEMDDYTWRTGSTFPSGEVSYEADTEDANHEGEMVHCTLRDVATGPPSEDINYEAEIRKIYGSVASASISYPASEEATFPYEEVNYEADVKKVYGWTVSTD